ncbi:MAG: TlpA family protein disulfide reductase [Gemmatimonadota bacterium]
MNGESRANPERGVTDGSATHESHPGPRSGGGPGGGPAGPRRRPWARWLPALAAIPFLALLAFGLTRDARIIESPLPGQPAPEFALRGLDADTLRLADLRGRVALVNFWASWCLPCRDEHPVLRELRRVYPESEVALVGILYQDSPENGRRFMRELGGDWPSAVDPGSRVAIEFGVYGVPESFFLAPDGTIVRKHIGPLTWELVQTTIDSLLAARGPLPATDTDRG